MSTSYRYNLCGLPDIYLVNGFKIEKSPYGGKSIAIDDVRGLHKAIGLDIVNKPDQITPEEIRYLRKEMDMSQVLLAEALGVTEITVRKWESRDGNKINKTAERFLRALYCEYATGQSKVFELIARITRLEREIVNTKRKVYKETKRGWQQQAA